MTLAFLATLVSEMVVALEVKAEIVQSSRASQPVVHLNATSVPGTLVTVTPVSRDDSVTNLQNLRFKMGIYSTYLRLRDGVPPTDSQDVLRLYISRLKTTVDEAIENSQGWIAYGSGSCQRFVKLKNEIDKQISFYVSHLVEQTESLSSERRLLMESRIKVLRFFSTGLFAMILSRSEAGRSELDIHQRSNCPTEHRASWVASQFRVQQVIDQSYLGLFGEPSALIPFTDAAYLNTLKAKEGELKQVLSVGAILAEIAASIIIWEKVVNPPVTRFTQSFRSARAGRAGVLVASGAYIASWVTLDRFLRQEVWFLRPLFSEDNFAEQNTVSRWERTLKFGELFIRQDLFSPSMYATFLQMMTVASKQRALNFINQNIQVLLEAETQYGSVERALQQTKEELYEVTRP